MRFHVIIVSDFFPYFFYFWFLWVNQLELHYVIDNEQRLHSWGVC